MSDAVGTWNATLESMIGTMQVRFVISESNGQLTGEASNDSETVPMLDLQQTGSALTWTQDVTKPMQLTLKFEAQLKGDSMTGTAKAGFLPGAKIVGQRSV